MALPLSCWQQLAEERIAAAMRDGAFDDLPGKGQPLVFEDDSLVPEDLRMAYKVLRNSGHVPRELDDRKEIQNLMELLEHCPDEQQRYRQIRKLNLLVQRLNLSRRRAVDLEESELYYGKIVERVPLVPKRPTPEPEAKG